MCSRSVNDANCLIKNLAESESLPHIRNLYEKVGQLSSVNQDAGGGNEVNGEREEEINSGNSSSVSEGAKEGKGQHSGSVCQGDSI